MKRYLLLVIGLIACTASMANPPNELTLGNKTRGLSLNLSVNGQGLANLMLTRAGQTRHLDWGILSMVCDYQTACPMTLYLGVNGQGQGGMPIHTTVNPASGVVNVNPRQTIRFQHQLFLITSTQAAVFTVLAIR